MEKSYKLFVGGLPVRVDKDLIVAFFSTYGTVLSCKLKKNQQTGRSLGFAYLNVKEKEACDRLLTEAVEFQGRIIEVKPVWKKKELGDKLEEEKRKKLFVSNLPVELTNEDLVCYFSSFGSVQNAFIIKDPDTNKNKNYGYVIFKEVEDLEEVFSCAEPHIIRPGVELKLERCLNSAEIALLKQTNSYRSSMKSSFFHSPPNTYNRNSSPCDDFSSPERYFARSEKNNSYYRSNLSPAKTSMSPNYNQAAPGRSFKRSTFSLPKKKKTNNTKNSLNDRVFQFREDNLFNCGSITQPSMREQIIRPHMIKSGSPVNQRRGYSEEVNSVDSNTMNLKDSSPKSSTKRSILALSERIDQSEENYRFYRLRGDSGNSPDGENIFDEVRES
jgi:RNA recognition motif-containing protein